MTRPAKWYLALAFAGAACAGSVAGDKGDDKGGPSSPMGAGGTNGGGGGAKGGPSAPSNTGGTGPSATGPAILCKAGADPGPTPMLKLSTLQYRNTVRDLLNASGLQAVNTEVKDLLAAIPDDSTLDFRGLDNRISLTHVLGYFNVAAAIAESVSSTPARLTAVAGACATQTPLPATCVDDFLSKFGRRALRHALTADELTSYKALNDGVRPPAEVFRALILSLLTAPRFVNHMEIDGMPINGREDMLQLSPYEVASRLSYTFWQTLPDDALLAAAADGSILTDAGLAKQVDRVFNDPRTKDTLWAFWNEWLRFEAFTGFDTGRPAFKPFAMPLTVSANLYPDMVQEIRDLVELYTWKQKGGLSDLLSSQVSVTKSMPLSQVYGLGAWSGMGDYPKIMDGSRAGLLQRGALLASTQETTNPFHRGALVRRSLLCDPLPQPDPNSLPPGSLDPPPITMNQTTRDRYDAKIQSPICLPCHTQFVGIGYVMEAYDSLGRLRKTEKVYDDKKGTLLAELPINSAAVAKVDLADMRMVNGPGELNQRIIESHKVDACLSINYFKYVFRHVQTDDSGDGCLLDDLRTQIGKGDTLDDVFKRVALHDNFRRKKVGAQ